MQRKVQAIKKRAKMNIDVSMVQIVYEAILDSRNTDVCCGTVTFGGKGFHELRYEAKPPEAKTARKNYFFHRIPDLNLLRIKSKQI